MRRHRGQPRYLWVSISGRRVEYLYTPSKFHTGGLLALARGRPRSVTKRGGDFSYFSYFVGFPQGLWITVPACAFVRACARFHDTR